MVKFLVMMVMVTLALGFGADVAAQDEPTAFVTNTPQGAAVVGGDVGGLVGGDEAGLSDETVAVVVDLLESGQATLVEVMQQQNTITFVFVVVVVGAAIVAVYKMAASRVPMPVFEQMQGLAKDVIGTIEKEAERRLAQAQATPSRLDDAGFGLMLSFLREVKGLVGAPTGGVAGVPPEGLSEVQRMYAAWAKGLTYDPAARPDADDGLG